MNGAGGYTLAHTLVAGDEELKRLSGINDASNLIRVGPVLIVRP